MQNVITIAERHGLLIVFLNFLLSQGGLPSPAASRMLVGISGVISGKLKVPDQAARSIC